MMEVETMETELPITNSMTVNGKSAGSYIETDYIEEGEFLSKDRNIFGD